jgi:hypothetical protein
MSRDTITAGSPASRQTVYQAIAAEVCGAGIDGTKS